MYLNNQQLAGYLRRTRSNPEDATFNREFVYQPQEQEFLDVFNNEDPLVSDEIQAYLNRTGGQPGTFEDVFVMDHRRPMYSYPYYTNTNVNNQQQNQQQNQEQNQNINKDGESEDKSSKLPVLAFIGVVLVGGIYFYNKVSKADDETIAGFLP